MTVAKSTWEGVGPATTCNYDSYSFADPTGRRTGDWLPIPVE